MISDQPALRQRMVIQSKCGIRDGYYDFSKAYILESVDGILSRLGTDYLDILLLHRPDVLMEPEEVAEAFDQLERSGKVRYFGVSNQNPMQMELLGQTVHQRLILNQLQLSAVHTPVVDSGIAANTLLPSLGELYLQNTLEQYDRGVLPGKPVSRNSRRLCLSRRQNGRIRRCLLSAGMPEKKSTTRTSRETTGFLQQNRSCSIR